MLHRLLLNAIISETNPIRLYGDVKRVFLAWAESNTDCKLSHNNTILKLHCEASTLYTIFPTLRTLQLHVHEHHEAPAEPSHQKHGDLHAVDDQVIKHPKVQAPVA